MAVKTDLPVICVPVADCFLTIKILQLLINAAAIQVLVQRMTEQLIKFQMVVKNISRNKQVKEQVNNCRQCGGYWPIINYDICLTPAFPDRPDWYI